MTDDLSVATKVLNEYIRKDFVSDDERLKQGKALFRKDYVQEEGVRILTERVSLSICYPQ